MKISQAPIFSFGIAGVAMLVGMTFSSCDRATETGEGEIASVDFVNDVKPILQTQCIRCHNDETIMGGLNLMNREVAMRGSSRGPVIVPGEPDKSLLYRVTLMPADEDHAMPATGAKLTEAEKKILFQWVKDGAEWPEGEAGTMMPIKANQGKA
ncbi:MAG: hypothetical protein KDN20_16320 [Verrucomicrobiae bacterium]|nr:hypothetical protein [Verrucomicrobiae bacterium]